MLGYQFAITRPLGRKTYGTRRWEAERSPSLLAFLIIIALTSQLPFSNDNQLWGRPSSSDDPEALWRIVNLQCVPNQQQNGDPYPCLFVNLQGGYALLKDKQGIAQILLIPTTRITGIESTALLDKKTANYFAEAWHARSILEALTHGTLPRTGISLVVNSASARSQNQLHIHVDCVQPDVIEALRTATIGYKWAPLNQRISGHDYLAIRIDGEQLNANPFDLLADKVPGARRDMGQRSVVVVGTSGNDGTSGFVILETHVDRDTDNLASGEEVQDHSCSIAGGGNAQIGPHAMHEKPMPSVLSPVTKCTKAGQYCVTRESSSGTCHVQEATESPLGAYLAGPFANRKDGNKEMCRRYDPGSPDTDKCGAVAPQGVCDPNHQ